MLRAYAYGRRRGCPQKAAGRLSTGRVTRLPQDYHVLLKEHVPAYITWAQYERNLARLAANRARAETVGRSGMARRSWLAYWCAAHAAVACSALRGPRQVHTLCNRLATTYGGPIASISRESPSMPCQSVVPPRSRPQPSRCRWRRPHAVSRSVGTSTGCGSNA